MFRRHYVWQKPISDPAVEIHELRWTPPHVNDPVEVWQFWHERHIACWEWLAVRDATMYAWHLKEIGGEHEKALKELIDDPVNGGRQGYWSL